jgi:hypothetical protein
MRKYIFYTMDKTNRYYEAKRGYRPEVRGEMEH